MDVRTLFEKAIETRDRMLIAKALSAIEEGRFLEVADLIVSKPRSHIVGVTGSPGVGKSTLINALIAELRRRGKKVAVIAIDPSSPLSGGAFLGNRVRVRTLDDYTFFRSISTPPEKSLPLTALLMIEFMNTLGYDYVLIETPGAGQVNVDVCRVAHTTLVVVQPLAGDDIQVLKAGIMEIGDIYVLNKADLPQANIARLQLETFLRDVERDGWKVRIVETSAINGNGVPQLVDTIEEHAKFLNERGIRIRRDLARRKMIVERIIEENLVSSILRSVEEHVKELSLDTNPISFGYEVCSKVLEALCSLRR